MKYSLRGLGGWMGKSGAGSGSGRGKCGLGELPGTGCGSCPISDPRGTGEVGNFGQGWIRARIRCNLMDKDQMQYDGCWTLHPLHPFSTVRWDRSFPKSHHPSMPASFFTKHKPTLKKELGTSALPQGAEANTASFSPSCNAGSMHACPHFPPQTSPFPIL